jgi:hypothetical protein
MPNGTATFEAQIVGAIAGRQFHHAPPGRAMEEGAGRVGGDECVSGPFTGVVERSADQGHRSEGLFCGWGDGVDG